VLSLAAVIALFAMMLLDVLRARLLAAAGAALDRRLGPRVLEGLMAQTARLSGAGHSTACATSPRCARSSAGRG
jgi:ABC-type protease/lipase transport system fused ATPase/permease subunit